MTDSKLAELLERAADETEVGPPPLDAMYAGACRRRRRRTVLLTAATAATVAAAIGGTNLLTSKGDPAPVTAPSPAPSPVATRLVGLGHAAIAVPASWGTNQQRCGTPQRDTVMVDVGAILLCMATWPVGVDSVTVGSGEPRRHFTAGEEVQVAGVPAQRQRTTCAAEGTHATQVCSSTVLIPSLGVWFRVDSATNAAEVDRILTWIVIVPDRVGVPGFNTIDRNGHQPSGAEYAATLEQAGLTPKIKTKKSPGSPAGNIFTVSPAPGTMLAPGSTVTVTVAG